MFSDLRIPLAMHRTAVAVVFLSLVGCSGSPTLSGQSAVVPANGLGADSPVHKASVVESVLFTFRHPEQQGEFPYGGLTNMGGILYGITHKGGAGKGTVFSVNSDTGAETVLYSFSRESNDGEDPGARPTILGDTLYGTTVLGGAHNMGTVFSVNPGTGAETVLYSFGGKSGDGAYPEAALTDGSGTLYGTTIKGGANDTGTVFSVNPSTGAETVLYSFGSKSNDGEYPVAWLIDVGGKLYGTTEGGGASGGGTVFSINGQTGAETILHSFGSTSNDGTVPKAGLVDVGGTLYGTTSNGGESGADCYNGCGTVFSVDPHTGAETVLYRFAGAINGANPNWGVIDVGGTLYGTTSDGGYIGSGAYYGGTVFSVNPHTGAETVLYTFGSGSDSADGKNPTGGLIDVGGTLYSTAGGGTKGRGVVYSITGF
jgi:uncharacterized repeat protein (TIGR03803 family)